MFDPLFEGIGWLLGLFYSLVPDLGVAIILLTFTIMLLLYPLNAKSAKSMIAMQRLQPELKRLQTKYKQDRQKLNEETMRLFQAHKVNPLAGCLPLIPQMLVLFVLFRVLHDSYKYVPTKGGLSDLFVDLCTRNGAVQSVKECGKHVTHLGFISTDFLDLRISATGHHSGLVEALPYFALVLGVIFVGYLQSRQAQRRTPTASRQMAMVMKFLPIFFGLISLNFPSGLVLYFFVSSLWRLGQQEVIYRRHFNDPLPALPVAQGGPARAAAVDVESPRRVEPVAPPDAGSAPPARVPAQSGGLRRLFQLPPPPGGAPLPPTAPGPGAPARRPATTGQASTSGRVTPSGQRSRRKKKRKR